MILATAVTICQGVPDSLIPWGAANLSSLLKIMPSILPDFDGLRLFQKLETLILRGFFALKSYTYRKKPSKSGEQAPQTIKPNFMMRFGEMLMRNAYPML